MPYTGKPFELYRILKRVSPAPYMFYFSVGNTVILGASPEKLVSVHQGIVEMNPIAGTRRRTDENQASLEKDLLNDPKERAEHVMLVDLARNDVGAVCEPGSVHVKDFLSVKHFSHVSHLVSVVQGKLAKNKDALDALKAAFPAGTVTGAPKIRAMEIIEHLETSRRGLYGGAVCRMDYEGNLDSCLAIRMATVSDQQVTVRAGAGIVYDSDPQAEANETRYKALALIETVMTAPEKA